MNERLLPSELIINPDGSCFHLHLRPEQIAEKIILVGDPGALPLSLHTLVKLSAKSLIENLKQLQAPTKEKDYPLFQRESDATI